MKLYLVQHGDALPKEVDAQRRLSDRGKEDVTRVSLLLRKAGIQVSRIYHSGKKRAEETAQLLSACLSANGELVQRDGIAPLDPVDEVANEVENWDEDVMLVGHLPFMGRLVSRLVVGDEGVALVEFQPGTVVCLELFAEGDWVIVWIIRPELLAG